MVALQLQIWFTTILLDDPFRMYAGPPGKLVERKEWRNCRPADLVLGFALARLIQNASWMRNLDLQLRRYLVPTSPVALWSGV